MLDSLLHKLSSSGKQKKIIYPDIDDARVFEAIKILIDQGEYPVICGKKGELTRYSELISTGLNYFEVPDNMQNTLFAAEKLSQGEVDGFVGGNISTTSEVVISLIKNVGSQQGISRISSHFLFGRDKELFLYSDGGIQIDPTAEQLAEIGYLTVLSAIKYGIEPRVAMLSFSTAGSGGDHPKVLKVREATEILRSRLQGEGLGDIPLEGEIQFDAAFIPEIGQRKNPQTSLKQAANVCIFPDLDSANIAYKITERLAGYIALGPIIQGLAKPGNDLSRGCSVEDIVAMHHITKNQ